MTVRAFDHQADLSETLHNSANTSFEQIQQDILGGDTQQEPVLALTPVEISTHDGMMDVTNAVVVLNPSTSFSNEV